METYQKGLYVHLDTEHPHHKDATSITKCTMGYTSKIPCTIYTLKCTLGMYLPLINMQQEYQLSIINKLHTNLLGTQNKVTVDQF